MYKQYFTGFVRVIEYYSKDDGENPSRISYLYEGQMVKGEIDGFGRRIEA